jgi:hypothetical protein
MFVILLPAFHPSLPFSESYYNICNEIYKVYYTICCYIRQYGKNVNRQHFTAYRKTAAGRVFPSLYSTG